MKPVVFLLAFLSWNGLQPVAARAAQAPTKIAAGYASMSATSAILWAAQDQKMLARNGIEADLVFMPGSPTLIAAINSGGIAVGFTGGTARVGSEDVADSDAVCGCPVLPLAVAAGGCAVSGLLVADCCGGSPLEHAVIARAVTSASVKLVVMKLVLIMSSFSRSHAGGSGAVACAARY